MLSWYIPYCTLAEAIVFIDRPIVYLVSKMQLLGVEFTLQINNLCINIMLFTSFIIGFGLLDECYQNYTKRKQPRQTGDIAFPEGQPLQRFEKI